MGKLRKGILQFQSIMNLLQKTDAHLIVLLCHHNADPDAICSAYAFSQILRRTQPSLEVEVAAAQGVNKLSKQVLMNIPMNIVASPRIEEADMIVLLDTNTIQQLDDWKTRVENSGKPLIVIDHHAVHSQTEHLASLYIIDEEASSTCEVVFELFRQADMKPDKMEALALFLGIVYDTKHFAIATSNTFKVAAELIEAGVNAEEALSLLAMPMDSSERIARLKAANRLSILKIGEWLLVFSRIGTYQASAARALLSLGAHVAVVGGEKEGALRISMRASKEFYQRTGVHLGKNIAKPLGDHVQGMGGGHSTSAGFNGEGDLEAAFRECIRLFQDKLKS